MVIKVEEAMKKIQRDMAPKMERLEGVLDEAILGSENRFPVTIDVKLLGADYGLIQSCLDKYKQNGWNAKYVSDQRDGDFVSIEPKKQSRKRERPMTLNDELHGGNYFGPYGMGVSPFN